MQRIKSQWLNTDDLFCLAPTSLPHVSVYHTCKACIHVSVHLCYCTCGNMLTNESPPVVRLCVHAWGNCYVAYGSWCPSEANAEHSFSCPAPLAILSACFHIQGNRRCLENQEYLLQIGWHTMKQVQPHGSRGRSGWRPSCTRGGPAATRPPVATSSMGTKPCHSSK
jgi:hypothetical protein